MKVSTRHPNVPDRALPLTEQRAEVQRNRGLYVVERGETFALPVDRLSEPTVFLQRELWRKSKQGVHRPGVKFAPLQFGFQRKALEFLRDHVNASIPHLYYLATLGHDLHVSTWGNLFAKHWHAGWANPFTGKVVPAIEQSFATLRDTHFVPHACDLPSCPASWGSWDSVLRMLQGRGGFVENLGWLSGAKVTDAFVSEEIDELVSAVGTEYADFDSHEVGTSAQAEDNNDTALIATSGIARAAGTPTDADPIYRSVATVTADATETWEEHGLFNNTTGAALMDRSLTGGQSVNSSDQVSYTYELTKAAEA